MEKPLTHMAVSPTTLRRESVGTSKVTPHSWWVSLFVLCAVLGSLLGLSVKSENLRRQKTDASNVLILETQISDQQRTIAALEAKRSQYETSIASETKQTQVLADDLKQTRILAGLTAVAGPGLKVILNDNKKSHPLGTPTALIMPDIIHDTDINQVVNELRVAGAEAIAINDQRLVSVSAVRCAGPTVYVNNTPQTPPFVISAIGDPKTLQDAMNLPGGIADTLRGIAPSMIAMEKSAKLVIPAYSGAIQPKYAVAVSSKDKG